MYASSLLGTFMFILSAVYSTSDTTCWNQIPCMLWTYLANKADSDSDSAFLVLSIKHSAIHVYHSLKQTYIHNLMAGATMQGANQLIRET